MKLEELLEKIATHGWDWPDGEYSWLSSRSGLTREERDGGYTSIFFIHGGRIREQAHIPRGRHGIDSFVALVKRRTEGLEDAYVVWSRDTGDGDADLWVEGTRLPTEDDMRRLVAAQDEQKRSDEKELAAIMVRRKL